MALRLFKSTRPDVLNAALVVTLTAILFGGASRLDVIAPVIPRLCAIGALAWLLWSAPRRSISLSPVEALLLTALVAIPLIQLLPLPWSAWTALPGRAQPGAVYVALGEQPWLPISLAPSRTLNALLALLPALAAYLIGRRLDVEGRAALITVLAVLAAASALLGLVQFAAGGTSALYFYAVTNRDSSVGFFANANHQALFICAGIVMTMAWIGNALRAKGKLSGGEIMLASTGFGVLAISLIPTFSRAGVALAVVAFAAGAALLPGNLTRASASRLFVAGAALLLLFLGGGILMAYNGLLGDRFALGATEVGRVSDVPVFARIARDFLPFGSGLGSFDPIYRGYETLETMGFGYLNNAHNDYAQIAIETGVLGIAFVFLFLGWFAVTAWRAWFQRHESDRVSRQQRAASILIFLLLAHSIIDYPLRTAALSVVFAFACAFLSPPSGVRRAVAPKRRPNLDAQAA